MNAYRFLFVVLALFGLSQIVLANPLRYAQPHQPLAASSDGVGQPAFAAEPRANGPGSPPQRYLVNPAARATANSTANSVHAGSSTGIRAKIASRSESAHPAARGPSDQAAASTRKQAGAASNRASSWISGIFGKRTTSKPKMAPPKAVQNSSGKMVGDGGERLIVASDQTISSKSSPGPPKAERPVAPVRNPQSVKPPMATSWPLSRAKSVKNSPPPAAVRLPATEAKYLQESPPPPVMQFPEREKIIYRPLVADVNRFGQAVWRPDIRLANGRLRAGQEADSLSSLTEPVPLPEGEEIVLPERWSAPIVDVPAEQCAARPGPIQELCLRIAAHLNGPRAPQPGIGTERVMHAISFIDTTQPQNNLRMRLDAAYDLELPDRAEYFWAKIGGRGPTTTPSRGGELSVDYQDLRVYMELGGKRFSVGTDIPIRILDPVIYGNTAGIGDITITTKTVLMDGKEWQLTNLIRTYIPSGNSNAGLGTQHASIEPGMAIRYKWSDITYFHGDLKFWIPLGADPIQGGEVLNYGVGMSHVWYEDDTSAIMPTLEFIGFSFLDGQVTPPVGPPAPPVDVDGTDIFYVNPGIRWVWDSGGDCGVREFGLFGSFNLTSESLHERLLRLEYRWTW